MMGAFENADLRRHKPRRDRALDVRADVARQQQRDIAIHDLEDDGVIVADPLALPGRRRWVKPEHASVAETKLVAVAPLLDYDAGCRCACEHRLQRACARNWYPLPQIS